VLLHVTHHFFLSIGLTIVRTYCAYPWKDGQAELAWVAWLNTNAVYLQTVTRLSTNPARHNFVGEPNNVFGRPNCHHFHGYTTVIFNQIPGLSQPGRPTVGRHNAIDEFFITVGTVTRSAAVLV